MANMPPKTVFVQESMLNNFGKIQTLLIFCELKLYDTWKKILLIKLEGWGRDVAALESVRVQLMYLFPMHGFY